MWCDRKVTDSYCYYHFQSLWVDLYLFKFGTEIGCTSINVLINKRHSLLLTKKIPVGTRFSARPDRPWGPLSLLYNWYRVFPGGKVRPGPAADHSVPSSAAIMEECSYTSTHPLGHTGPVTGSLYLYIAYQ